MAAIPGSPSTGSFSKATTPPISPPAVDDLVLALYDFPATTPSTNRCLSFKAGQVIRVVNRDKSGWWDGEMIQTSKAANVSTDGRFPPAKRGWFPSNYVSPIPPSNIASFQLTQKPAYVRRPSAASLTSSIATANDFLLDSPLLSLNSTLPDLTPAHSRGGSISTLASQNQAPSSEAHDCSTLWGPIALAIRTLHSQVRRDPTIDVQPPTAKIISAVRAALNSTGCLARHSPTLRHNPNLSRARKQLLSALSSMVDQARVISPSSTTKSNHSSQAAPQSHQPEEIETLLRLSDQILSHVRELLGIAQRSAVTSNTPSSPKPSESLAMSIGQRSMSLSSPNPPDPHGAPRMIRPCKSVGTLLQFPSYESLKGTPSIKSSKAASSIHHHHRRLDSITSVQSTISNPSSATFTLVSVTHILGLIEKTHDQVLSTVAVFIGHAHIHSSTAHPASHAHLIDMTRDVIENVCEMLTLVECISKNPTVRALPPIKNEPPLGPARESLYVSTTGLVTSARVATSASPTMSCPTSPEEEEADSLLASATAVLRSTNSCMDAVSACLTRMDPGYAEFELSSNRPSFHAYFNTSSFPDTNGSLSMRSRHTLSMLGRKASALAFTRNPFEPENQNNWSAVSQNWKKSDTSSIEPSAASDVESLYTPDTSFMAQTKEAAIKQGTQAPRTSPSLSTLSSSDGIDLVRASPSTANSSDGRYSRESSPATSTSVSHPEEELAPVIDRHPTPAQRPNPKALALPPLQIPTGSSGSQNPDSWQKELLLNTDGQVMGGTLRGLVGRMTSHDTPVEATFFHSFFMTFRLFTTSVEFSNALIARFSLTFELNTPVTSTDPSNNISKVTPIRLRVYNVMKSWLELHWRMETDEVVLPVIMRWAESQLSTALPVPAERLIDLVQKRMKESQLGIQPAGSQARTKAKQVLGAAKEENYGKLACPSPIISKTVMSQLRASSFNFSALQLSDFDPIELARQITLMESKLYQAIQPEEVIGQLFNKKSGSAVNVRAMSALSTKMTGWFTETILNEDDLRKRTQILKFLIKLGSKLLEMQNYNALMSVMSALNSSTILRLKRTWEGVGNKARVLFENMNKAVSHQRNYAEYRATLRHARTPCIPFLGVYLTDMTFCHEGNPTHRASPDLPGVQLINFDKYQKMTKIMNEIERFQVPFNFSEVPQITAYIRMSMSNLMSYQDSADELYQRSLQIEPREPSHLPPPPSSSAS
ncbi:hypothetical protein PGT21_005999 [Puccinia graminis f. sp. tritici]|uniref:Uncharacterized protein n=1 Tax=Puccinia graminis f. sp. tritici TaxID=56615 RepID=A0A5B0P804_PUCGR|nr:hypothetical protein PGT21_005999 [Puccinia graminis f. sp. tritici]